jgi:hypothetical protein
VQAKADALGSCNMLVIAQGHFGNADIACTATVVATATKGQGASAYASGSVAFVPYAVGSHPAQAYINGSGTLYAEYTVKVGSVTTHYPSPAFVGTATVSVADAGVFNKGAYADIQASSVITSSAYRITQAFASGSASCTATANSTQQAGGVASFITSCTTTASAARVAMAAADFTGTGSVAVGNPSQQQGAEADVVSGAAVAAAGTKQLFATGDVSSGASLDVVDAGAKVFCVAQADISCDATVRAFVRLNVESFDPLGRTMFRVFVDRDMIKPFVETDMMKEAA